jgi:hypothetical protein
LTAAWFRRERRRSCAIAGLGAVVAVGGLVGHTFAADKPSVAAPAAKALAMPGAPSAMTEAAAKAGVLSCAGRIDQVSKFLGAGNEISFLFMMPPPPRDQRLVTSAMEIDNKSVPSAYASADFAATAQGCGASYQTVTYWPLSCQDVVTRYFSTVRQAPALGRSIATLDGGGSTRIFLMPAGAAGCVTIKKELL